MVMGLKLLSAFAFLLTVALPLHANPAEVLVELDGICISSRNDVSLIENIAIASGGKPLPQEILTQDPAIYRSGGKGFSLKKGKFKYLVLVSNAGGCSVIAENIPQVKFRKLIERSYPLIKQWVDTSGPQSTYIYKIQEPSFLAGGIFRIVQSNKSAGINFTSIGYIPREKIESILQYK